MVQVSDLEKQLQDQKDEIAKLQATVAQLKTKQIQNKSVSNAKQKMCCNVCNKAPGRYPCKKCAKVLSCQDSLDRHMKALHFENYLEKSLLGFQAYNFKTKRYECGLCHRPYRRLEDLKQHVRASH